MKNKNRQLGRFKSGVILDWNIHGWKSSMNGFRYWFPQILVGQLSF